MRKSTSFMALAGAAALVLSGCANDADEDTDTDNTDTTSEDSGDDGDDDASDDSSDGAEDDGADEGIDYSSIDGSDFKACLVSDAGGWDDNSFNESAYNGLQKAIDEMGVDSATAESTSDADFQPNVDTMVSENCDLIIGVGFNLQEATHNAADANPDLNFGLVDAVFTDDAGDEETVENARPLVFNTAEAAFLAGYVAAGTTETGIVGTFGGMPIPSVQIFMDGFADGVDAYNEAHGESVELLGWDKESQTGSFTNSFDDQAKGQQVADGFISQGADIIMPVAGPVGLGAAAAAQSAGDIKIVGVDSDWYESAPEFSSIILTSVVKKIDQSVLDTIAADIQGEFDSEAYIGTLENGGVDIAPFHDFEGDVPEDVVSEVEDLKQQIIDGDLVIDTPNAP